MLMVILTKVWLLSRLVVLMPWSLFLLLNVGCMVFLVRSIAKGRFTFLCGLTFFGLVLMFGACVVFLLFGCPGGFLTDPSAVCYPA